MLLSQVPPEELFSLPKEGEFTLTPDQLELAQELGILQISQTGTLKDPGDSGEMQQNQNSSDFFIRTKGLRSTVAIVPVSTTASKVGGGRVVYDYNDPNALEWSATGRLRASLADLNLFSGEDEIFACKRAISRLYEMQSQQYLADHKERLEQWKYVPLIEYVENELE